MTRQTLIHGLRIALLVLLACCPALFTARLIARFGVNIPYADEWVWAPFLLKAREHSLSFADFFTQHNEHRYVFPKLLLLAIAPLSSGNTKGAMFFSLGLVLLTSAALWYILCRTVQASLAKRLLLLAVLNLVLFSPVQAENWTWGYQFVLFLMGLLLVSGIAVAVSERPITTKFLLCFAIALVATFSFGGGVILWPLTFPLALWMDKTLGNRARWTWLLGWLAAAGASIALYLFRYSKPAYHPPLAASHNVIDYYLYVTTFLGGHLSRAERSESILVAALFGTLLLSLYLGGALWMLRSRNAQLRMKMLPWIGIGAFAVLNALLAAVTRIGFGLNQGLDSRYTTFSLYISLSVIGMLAVVATAIPWRDESKRRDFNSLKWVAIAWVMTACPTLLLLGHLYASWWGVGAIQQTQVHRLHGKAALAFANVLDAGPVYSRYLIANADQTQQFANMANSLGYIHPPLLESSELSRLRSRRRIGGSFERLTVKDDGSCEAVGWAVIPKQSRPADAVLLAYEDPDRGPVAFVIAAPGAPRPAVAEKLRDRRYEYSGWSCQFERSKVPAGDHLITAWAFDVEKMVLYPLRTPQILH